MKPTQKTQIAQDFVDRHKHSDLRNWAHNNKPLDIQLEMIYDDLAGGVFGNVETEGDQATIEICGFESESGNPILFDFEVEVV